MGKKMLKKNMALGIIMLLVVTCFVPGVIADNPVSIKTIYVDDDGGADYTRIQDAIDNTSNGNTIFVYSGTYYESITVDKSISLIGENRNTTVIDSYGSGDVIHITADKVQISNFTIQNSCTRIVDNHGIYVKGMDWHIITNNIITNNWFEGIFLWDSSNNIISNNLISYSKHYGIRLEGSNNNYLTGNNISHNPSHGICLSHSSNNIVDGNTICSNHGCGILFFGVSNCDITENVIRNNGEEAIYLHTKSNSNNISGNTIENNGFSGITMSRWCNNNIISRNTIINNNLDYIHNDYEGGGIGIHSSSNNIISDNDIRNSYGEEVYLSNSKNNIIIKNNIIDYGSIIDHTAIAFFKFRADGFVDLLNTLTKSFTNKFIRNYWNRPRVLPRPIMGKIVWYWGPSFMPLGFSWVVFDWFPAQKPYDISPKETDNYC